MSLEISDALVDSIRDHGRKAYPQECCGLLLGRVFGVERSVVDLKPVENAREDSRQNRYLIAPYDLLQAEKEAIGKGVEVIGVYHSHPDHPAIPSRCDRENALPWYSYIILSVAGGEARDLTSWTLRDDRTAFDGEDLIIRM